MPQIIKTAHKQAENKSARTQSCAEDENLYLEELEAHQIMAKEWNDFKVPEPIDEFITQAIYWKEKEKHQVILSIMESFDTLECYAAKCVWFSTQNYHHRIEEEARGAYYQSSFCKADCTPKQFRTTTESA